MKASNISDATQLWRVLEEVRVSGQPQLVQRNGEDVAVVMPAKRADAPPQRTRIPKGKPFTRKDSLWNIVGMAHSDGPGDVSENKHKYLADAYLPRHDA